VKALHHHVIKAASRFFGGGSEGGMLLLVLGAPVMGEWLKLSAIAVFVVGLCVAAYLANRP
jgi:hypothetical protein